MSDTHNHGDVIEGVKGEFREIFDGSSQSVYIFLDDDNKICNENFSQLLGYSSPQEWADVSESFPQAFVAESSQEHLIHTYQDAMEKKIGAQTEITWKKKDGGEVNTNVILVPIVFKGELLALHFIEKI